jgi:hypothetical protein
MFWQGFTLTCTERLVSSGLPARAAEGSRDKLKVAESKGLVTWTMGGLFMPYCASRVNKGNCQAITPTKGQAWQSTPLSTKAWRYAFRRLRWVPFASAYPENIGTRTCERVACALRISAIAVDYLLPQRKMKQILLRILGLILIWLLAWLWVLLYASPAYA